MRAVDVGANVGAVTHELLKAGASVIAVEPNPQAAATLRAACGDATVIEAAVTDHPGTVTYYHGRDTVHGSLYPAAVLAPTGEISEVPAITLDSLGPMDVVKIDAQGAEAAILRGAERTLAARRAIFYLELWPQGLLWAGDSVGAVRALFEAHGYRPAGKTWDRLVDETRGQQGHGASDVLIVPQERL